MATKGNLYKEELGTINRLVGRRGGKKKGGFTAEKSWGQNEKAA